jgi:hypothetical protein
MKNLYAVALMMVLGLTACGPMVATNGSGNVISESRAVKNFDAVHLSGSGKLVIEQSDVESLTITADDNLLRDLTSEVEGHTLKLSTRDLTFIHPSQIVTYKLLVKDLNSINVSGGAAVDAKGLRTRSLDINVSGAGDIVISGETEKQSINISGAGKYRADGFKSKDASVNISGIGSAILAVSDRLDVHVSGAGEVEYIGDPMVTERVSGAGSVKRKR